MNQEPSMTLTLTILLSIKCNLMIEKVVGSSSCQSLYRVINLTNAILLKGYELVEEGCQPDISGSLSPIVDDIKTEYHPHSGLPPAISRFEDFERYREPTRIKPIDEEPWKPFPSRFDFEIAEFALEVGLTKEQTNRFLGFFQRMTAKPSVADFSHLCSLWDAVSHRHAMVRVLTFDSQKPLRLPNTSNITTSHSSKEVKLELLFKTRR